MAGNQLGRSVYIERAGIGWRIVGEASPSFTGLPLWTAVRRWRLTRSAALAEAPKVSKKLDEAISFWKQELPRREARQRREVIES